MGYSVFFDLDGTLTDPQLGIVRCIAYAMEALGETPPPAEELHWCIGPPLRASLASLVGDARADEALALYRERFADVGLFENEPYSGVHEVLEELARDGRMLFVASSKPLVYVRRITERFELAGFFQQQFGAELDGRLTDKSELLAHALSITGASSGRSVMVGDRRHDVIGAIANGLPCIGAAYGYGGEDELRSSGAVSLARLVSDLPPLVDAVRKTRPG